MTKVEAVEVKLYKWPSMNNHYAITHLEGAIKLVLYEIPLGYSYRMDYLTRG